MTSGETVDSLGAALRSAREAAGVTVEQVSADTRIRATLIRDLEADRFASSGGAVYARGHLRAIASAVGADPAPLVARFDAEQGQVVPSLPIEADLGPRRPASFGGTGFGSTGFGSTGFGGTGLVAPVAGPDRTGPRWGIAVAGAAVVVAGVLAIGYSTSSGTPSASTPGTLVASPRPSASPTSPVVQPPDPGAVAAKPPVIGAQLRVRIIGGTSWVYVSDASARLLFQGLLRDGQFKDFTDPTRLKVVVGNAGAVNLNCGGQDGGPAGQGGAVRHFSCTAKGLTPSA